MSDINPGDLVVLRTEPPFSNDAGVPTDPDTVQLVWRRRGAPPKTLTYLTDSALTKDSTGTYRALVTPTRAGTYYFRWVGTGAAQASEEGTFTVTTKFG